jgi:hypothetical protein
MMYVATMTLTELFTPEKFAMLGWLALIVIGGTAAQTILHLLTRKGGWKGR